MMVVILSQIHRKSNSLKKTRTLLTRPGTSRTRGAHATIERHEKATSLVLYVPRAVSEGRVHGDEKVLFVVKKKCTWGKKKLCWNATTGACAKKKLKLDGFDSRIFGLDSLDTNNARAPDGELLRRFV